MTIDSKEELVLVDKIIEICKGTDLDKIKKDLRWEILGPLISKSNTFEGIDEYIRLKYNKEFDEAVQEEYESGNYSWVTAFHIMMDKIKDKLE